MPVKKCKVDGRTIGSLSDVYDELAGQLSFPACFGRNLDALWDVLSTDIEGPFSIEWKHADQSQKKLGRDFSRLTKLLRELEKERKDFYLTFEP